MDPVDVYSVRDLRLRSGDLLRDAEAGRLDAVTFTGAARPCLRTAVPFVAVLSVFPPAFTSAPAIGFTFTIDELD